MGQQRRERKVGPEATSSHESTSELSAISDRLSGRKGHRARESGSRPAPTHTSHGILIKEFYLSQPRFPQLHRDMVKPHLPTTPGCQGPSEPLHVPSATTCIQMWAFLPPPSQRWWPLLGSHQKTRSNNRTALPHSPTLRELQTEISVLKNQERRLSLLAVSSFRSFIRQYVDL